MGVEITKGSCNDAWKNGRYYSMRPDLQSTNCSSD